MRGDDVGDDWIDGGTTCQQKCAPWTVLGVCADWSDDEVVAKTAAETLAEKAIAKIKFQIEGFAVNPGGYELSLSMFTKHAGTAH